MSTFVLIFDGDDVASLKVSAWVGVNPQEHNGKPVVTHDCGSPEEFERAIRDLQAELDDVSWKGRAKFASHWKEKMAKREVD